MGSMSSSHPVKTCAGCKREIGYGNYLGCMGTFYHTQCFCCHGCGSPITEDEFSLSGKYTYHKSCFAKERIHPRCDVCHQFVPRDEDRFIQYVNHPYWSQKYCPSHEHDNTPRCCSCERFQSWNTRHTSLEDGRSLCIECKESAVMDTDACQPLYRAIIDFYEGLNMKIDQEIPLFLVGRQALNAADEMEEDGFHHSEVRGLCVSKERTVTDILKRPRIGGRGLVGIRRQPQKLVRRQIIQAIVALYGFPRLLTGAILAHELMHAWLRLHGFRNLRPEIEEGICQVVSHMWLKSEVEPEPTNTTPSVEKKLGEFFLYQIANMASPAYGGGFRAAMTSTSRYGFRRTLDHIRLTGDFPL